MAFDLQQFVSLQVETEQTYTTRDAILYALGIGLGADPTDVDQLRFVYERNFAAFPTLPSVLCVPPQGTFLSAPGLSWDFTKVVHGEYSLFINAPMPPQGRLKGVSRVTAVVDKGAGKGALVYHEKKIVDAETGMHYATASSTAFARGDGGFGGPAGPVRIPHEIPVGAPDCTIEFATATNATLLYRLNGDFNPLHADPEVARAAGFRQPILHGLCSYGMAAHAILKAYGGYSPHAIGEMHARLTAPAYPGEVLSFELWRDADDVRFRAWVRARNVKVLDNGHVRLQQYDVMAGTAQESLRAESGA